MAEWIGRTLSKVEVQKLLGRGGMADVYLGRHTTLNRPVAVKVLHSHLSGNESLLARFRAEAQSVAAMRHPHIVQVFDFDITDDRPYIVMELLEGTSLKEYLSDIRELGKQPSLQTITFLISSLASALNYAHARGIVHRDVKPANVMLRRDGPIDPAGPLPEDVEVVLTDFGIARMADATTHTASGSIIGTPQYMSPEQVRGEPADGRSDIYSLGVMLYEMLSGQLPFDGDTQASILIKQISEPPPPIVGISADLENVINRALAKDPVQRFQKATDLASALQAVASEPGAVSTAVYQATPAASPAPPTRELNLGAALSTDTAAPKTSALGPPPRRAFPAAWLLYGVGALVIIVVLALVLGLPQSSDVPGGSPEQTGAAAGESTLGAISADSGPVVGQVLLQGGTVALEIEGIPPAPEGSVYQAWLTEPGAEPLNLGPVEVTEEGIAFAYDDPEARNLILQYRGFALSIEPASDPDPAVSQIVYTGQIPEEHLSRLRLMFSVARGVAFQTAVLEGVSRQSVAFDAHLDNTINAIHGSAAAGYDDDTGGAGQAESEGGDLAMAKTHAEHVINIIVGRESPEFADYNGNGIPENPGDGVGLENYLLILQEAALASASSAGASADTVEIAGSINGHINEILLLVSDARNDELSVTAADTLEEVRPIGEDLESLHVQEAVELLLEEAQAIDLAVRIEIMPAQ